MENFSLIPSDIDKSSLSYVDVINYLDNAEEFVQVFSSLDSIVLSTMILSMGLFGMLANGVTVYVILTSSTLRSVFDYFILSLASSDFISALISPLAAYYRTFGFNQWKISTFLCKTFWSVEMGTSILTSLHIAVYSAMRFIAIKWPIKFSYFRQQIVKVVILFLWTTSVLCGSLPLCIWTKPFNINETYSFFTMKKVPACGIGWNWIQQYRKYSIYGFSAFFFLPFFLILFFSCGIALTIGFRKIKWMRVFPSRNYNIDTKQIAVISRQNNRPAPVLKKKEKQELAQLLLIVSSFLLGYCPMCAYQIYGTRVYQNTLDGNKFGWWFGTISVITLRFSECLNPIFYSIASNKFRAETLKCLKKMCSYGRKLK